MAVLLPALVLAAATFFSHAASAQEKEKIPLLHGAHRTGKRMDAEMVRWRGYGLGQFIHWGLYSILEGK